MQYNVPIFYKIYKKTYNCVKKKTEDKSLPNGVIKKWALLRFKNAFLMSLQASKLKLVTVAGTACLNIRIENRTKKPIGMEKDCKIYKPNVLK